MLRHSVFALVLVGAAFAGGAAINGPGLTWLQRTILGGPTIIVDGPSDAPSMASKKPNKPFPTARTSPLVVDLPRAPQQPNPTPAGPAAEEPEPLLPPESPSAPASALIRPVEPPTPDLGPAPAPVPALVRQAPTATRVKAPASLNLSPTPKTDPVARLASAEAPSTPLPPSADPSTAPDWAEIRKRLRNLGIARYSIEAEIDGRVRFSCIIPVDGLRAVGHQFEAEGDDEYQAAEAAIRRITLWQATELPTPEGPRTRD
jgi:hypothetical protein